MQRDGLSDLALSGARCPDCGKVRYVSRRAARKAASQLPQSQGRRMRAYKCGEFWHLTSQGTAKVTYFRDQDRGAAA